MKTSTFEAGKIRPIENTATPIEVTHYLSIGKFFPCTNRPAEDEEELVLIRRDGTYINSIGYDIFIAIHRTGVVSSIYLGHWNDGII